MMDIDPREVDLMRTTWRDVPAEYRSKQPDLVSLVRLDESGPKAGITLQSGSYVLEHDRDEYLFDSLSDAENAALRLLTVDLDMPEGW